MKFGKVCRNDGVLRRPQLRERPVEPRPGADTVARVDGGLSGTSLSAQIGVPGVTAPADSRRKRLAVRVGARSRPRSPPLPTPTLVTKKVIRAGVGVATWGRRDALGIRRALLTQHQAEASIKVQSATT